MQALKTLFFVIFSVAVAATGNAQSASAEDAAEAVFSKAQADFNAGNYDAYLAVIADDFEGYAGVQTPLRFEGKAAWSGFIMGLKNLAYATYDQRQADYRSYGDNTVLCNAYFLFTTVTNDGVVESQSGRETTVLVKIDGNWKIANYHFSELF